MRYFAIGVISTIAIALVTITFAQDTTNVGNKNIDIIDVLNEIAPENEAPIPSSESQENLITNKPIQKYPKETLNKTTKIPQATFTPPNNTTETVKNANQTTLVEFYPTIVSNCMIQDGEVVKCNFGAEYRKNRINELFTQHISSSQITRKQYETMLKEVYLLSHSLPETTSRQENNSAFMIEYSHYLLEKKKNTP